MLYTRTNTPTRKATNMTFDTILSAVFRKCSNATSSTHWNKFLFLLPLYIQCRMVIGLNVLITFGSIKDTPWGYLLDQILATHSSIDDDHVIISNFFNNKSYFGRILRMIGRDEVFIFWKYLSSCFREKQAKNWIEYCVINKYF